MATITAFTADRMKQIEDTTVVGGLVDVNGNLLLTTREGEEIDAGNVVGPQGPGFVNRGAWAPATVYAKNDVVVSNGSTFLVQVAHTSSSTAPTVAAPGANLSLWAQKGEDGIIGRNGDTAIPAGTVSLWTSDVAPTNWMICDGSAISRTQYASLFDAIGTKYGVGDGVNTFNLPNLKGRVPVGKDSAQTEFDALAKAGGAKTHKLTAAQSGLREHTHIMPMGTIAGVATTTDVPARASGTSGVIDQGFRTGRIADPVVGSNGVGTYNSSPLTSSVQTDATDSHNILQPFTVVNFIIKVTAGETPGDSELATRLGALESNFSGTPAGTMTIWPGDTAPTNWLLCDGAAVSRTTYASLFSAIGTRYGVGDGSSTFNLPNLKGRVPVGRDAAQTEFDVLGETGGTKTHNHQHISPVGSASNNTYVFTPYAPQLDSVGKYELSHIENVANVSGIGANGVGLNEVYKVTSSDSGTLQPYQVVNYIIKITNGDTKGDSQLTQRVSQLEVVSGTKSLGTISPFWVVGNPSVTLIPSGTVVTALHGSRGGPYYPGDKVLCENVSGVWYITDLVEANGPKFTHWIPLPILAGKTIRPWAPYSWGVRSIKYYDKDPAVPFWMTKNSSGVVTFQGLGSTPFGFAANEIFATLPVGFRPSTARRFPCIVSEVRTTLEISTNGDMRFNLAVAAGSWFSLSNAIFHDANQDLNWQPPTAFVNGYAESSSSYPVGFAVDEFGYCWARGIISTSGAARTDAQLMASFPASYMTSFEKFLPSANAPSPYVSIRPASGNGVTYRVPSGGAVPNLVMGLDGLMWAPSGLQSIFNGYGPGSTAADPLGASPFLNAWTNYNTTQFGYVGFNKRPDGLVYWQGLVMSGTVGYYPMFEIHQGYRPFTRTAFERIANGLHARIGIDPVNNAAAYSNTQGSMFTEVGANAWVDLTGVVYQAAQ